MDKENQILELKNQIGKNINLQIFEGNNAKWISGIVLDCNSSYLIILKDRDNLRTGIGLDYIIQYELL